MGSAEDILCRIKNFIERVELFYVATSDQKGEVHLAVVKDLIFLPDTKHIAFKSWFCKKTIENIQKAPNISIAIYDAKSDTGYQIIGKAVSKSIVAVLNGYAPELEKIEKEYPQEEYQLTIKITNIMDLHRVTHSDKYLLST
ncbi:MAG: pyridoxamine 5'-phosphate oxidase family protein [Candidatus Brocadia sp. AMX2]|uniref:Pyridoxamine 5'-phosphate oxidase-related FMN-binding protein n=1 Tax=Candidatus Brocadia sinica JPN1 TaxID=1197129 RepID=A0ABQ0K2K9_9BACT|nr:MULTISPECIES: pyridoxamine 5'-phosphate oxidase family protein [Brocadia]KXK32059.1 MAG: Pyridoxamine 5'-phosphate oxidase [Candidatus Brocadia sinica]MBC6933746.1 pyridoxamine 5'-phosphate oxidase family protein [Candidatus Brocadia sp.]MBL1170139.1 pyridoxamine 5'-phosphate oxidase family protein [Candidatus Brocadia sp. AMX1]NOG43051.1 pyridoxamine 5'-phosphate oxidase family protein [Planctomycetota bacterium]KAA0242916.1 MAG: pyridoxamine 5'-phosphate oxidase family protein [Candidatus